jgi:hypothetical protein
MKRIAWSLLLVITSLTVGVAAAGEEWGSGVMDISTPPLVIKSDDVGSSSVGRVVRSLPAGMPHNAARQEKNELPGSGESITGATNVEEVAKQVIEQRASSQIMAKRRKEELERVKVEADIAKSIKECKDAGGCKGSEYSSYSPMDYQSLFGAQSATSATNDSTTSSQEFTPLPALVQISGNEGVFSTLVGKIRAQKGYTLPGGYAVGGITTKSAVITKDGVDYKIDLSWTPDAESASGVVGVSQTNSSISIP